MILLELTVCDGQYGSWGGEEWGGAGRLQELVLIAHLGKGECVMISSIYPMETPRRRGEIICAQSHGGAVGKSALETQVCLTPEAAPFLLLPSECGEVGGGVWVSSG